MRLRKPLLRRLRQNIALQNFYVWRMQFLSQTRRQITVHFDRHNLRACFTERPRQSPQPGSNFKNRVRRADFCCPDDFVQDVAVAYKVLPKPFTRSVRSERRLVGLCARTWVPHKVRQKN